VARAAVLYVFRVLTEQPIPMNAGCLKPINLIIPEGSHAAPALSARRGGRQCGNQPARDQRHVRCATKALAAARAR
jgi:N-methylhydantoinase B/oxoprolinase/acetone carboxylase alpha subunit